VTTTRQDLTVKEWNKAIRWYGQHASRCEVPHKARRITWEFSQTGIGVAITVTCSCGSAENVTDYGSW
jgi:hypothetical protein